MLRDIAGTINWIATALLKPLSAIHDIKTFFKEMWSSLKTLGSMIKKDPKKGLANFFGGFLFYVTHHSVEFTAQTALLLAAGFAAIPPLSDAVQVGLKSMFTVSATSSASMGSV